MTPEQKIKHLILTKVAEWNDEEKPPFDPATIDALWDALVEGELHWDPMNEVREGEAETDIPSPSSRHYESKSVAAQAVDGLWVGWTYWYGGGKHAEPEAIDWMESAYDLSCVEEQKTATVRTFTKAPA